MSRTKKIAILAIIAMVLTMMPVSLFAATADDTRLAGTDRIGTALEIASAGSWGKTVILAPADQANLVDALAAAPLAGQENAPILLTFKGSLDANVKAKIAALGATKVYVIGAISEAVAAEVDAIDGVTVEKLAGADRWATADAINAKLTSPAGTFVIGYDAIPDALSAASYAAKNKFAIVLAKADGTVDSSKLVGATKYIVGGTAKVKDIAGVTRIAGADRFATNKAVVDTLAFSYDRVYVANGLSLVDALAVAPLAAKYNAFVALASGTDVAAAATVNAKLTASSKVIAVGGTSVVSDAVKAKVGYDTGSALAVQSVAATDLNHITVVFNKAVDKASAENTANYTLDNGNLVAGSLDKWNTAGVDAPTAALQADGKTVVITLDTDNDNVADSMLVNQLKATIGVQNVLSADKTETVAAYTGSFTFVDTTAPTVTSVTALGNKVLQVQFSEDVFNANATSAYYLNGASLATYSLSNITYSSASRKATLNFVTPLPTTVTKMTVSQDNSITDKVGLKLLSTEVPVTVTNDTTPATVQSATLASNKAYLDIVFSKPMAFVTDFAGAPLVIDGTVDVMNSLTLARSIVDGKLRLRATGAGTDFATIITGGAHAINLKNDTNIYLKDAFDVKMAASSATYTITNDVTKPTVLSVAVTADKKVEVKFSENLDATTAQNALNYTIKDVDGNDVTINSALFKTSTTDTVVLTLAASLKPGTTSITVAAVKDTSGNVMDTYTGTFAAADKVGPSVVDGAGNTTVAYSGQNIYVTYSEAVDTTTALNAANYLYKNKALPAGSSLSMISSNKVKIVVPLTTTLAGGDAFSVSSNIADTAGNKMDGFGWAGVLAAIANTLDIVAYDANHAGPVMTDTKTLKFKLNQELKSLDITDFVYRNDGTNDVPLTTALATASFTNSNGKATVTIQFASAVCGTDALNTSNPVEIKFKAAGPYGTKATDDTTFKAGGTLSTLQTAADMIAPELLASDPVITMDADGNGKIDHIIVIFKENMNSTFLSNASFTVAGYTVTSVATENNIAANITTAASVGSGAAAPTVVIRVNEKAFDTAATPAVTFNGTMKDANNNTFVLPTTAKVAVDKAAPVIVSATKTGANAISLTFSEPVYSTNAASGALAADDITLSPLGTVADLEDLVTITVAAGATSGTATTATDPTPGTSTIGAKTGTSIYDAAGNAMGQIVDGTATETIIQ